MVFIFGCYASFNKRKKKNKWVRPPVSARSQKGLLYIVFFDITNCLCLNHSHSPHKKKKVNHIQRKISVEASTALKKKNKYHMAHEARRISERSRSKKLVKKNKIKVLNIIVKDRINGAKTYEENQGNALYKNNIDGKKNQKKDGKIGNTQKRKENVYQLFANKCLCSCSGNPKIKQVPADDSLFAGNNKKTTAIAAVPRGLRSAGADEQWIFERRIFGSIKIPLNDGTKEITKNVTAAILFFVLFALASMILPRPKNEEKSAFAIQERG
ncbi:hypothetical protein RFI_31447 [Reticulomyxa filosa]|uniref:Uncharacterized protein n=1 Tax=Reticulomyxa filosa TaxID=46433 RepID=X6LZ03_RETFI|nr:hypothetical protein RFI_31447 [Reticulomyxa filosa]|eukprot:ETO05950.1 hypothetical protein RFI_31447 [Reticulomyxa filosa]